MMAQVHKAEGPRPSHSLQAKENNELSGRGARKLMNAGQASSLGSAAQDMQDDVQATDGMFLKTHPRNVSQTYTTSVTCQYLW